MNKDKYIDLIQSDIMREHMRSQKENVKDEDLCRFVLFSNISLKEKATYISNLAMETNNSIIINIEKWFSIIFDILHSADYTASIVLRKTSDLWNDGQNDKTEYITNIIAQDLEEFISDIHNVYADEYEYIEVYIHRIAKYSCMKEYITLYGYNLNGKLELTFVGSPYYINNLSSIANTNFTEDEILSIEDIFNGTNLITFPFKSDEDTVELRIPIFKEPIVAKIHWDREFDDIPTSPIYAWLFTGKNWDSQEETISLYLPSLTLSGYEFLGWQNWLYPHTIEEKDTESQTKK